MSLYKDLVIRLFSLPAPKKRRSDLASMLKAAKALGSPEREFPSVHIAGTNGKGSVAVKLAKVLEENGYRVGLFTSPHLFTYRERFQINGKMISEKKVCQYLERILPLFEHPTFFEVSTLLAFLYLAEKQVDIAIIETGLGGRLDPTNIVDPILSIITSIGYDHTEILGKTLDEIAKEKGGIIKERAPVVLGSTANRKVLIEMAKAKNVSFVTCKEGNLNIVRAALKLLPFNVESTNGLKFSAPCRFEMRGDLILDVAHNPAAFERLFEKVKRMFPKKKLHVLLGMGKDKDIEGSLKVILKYADHLALMPPNHPRLSPKELFSHGTPMTFDEAKAYAKKNKALAILTGSFYVMNQAGLPQTSPQSLP